MGITRVKALARGVLPLPALLWLSGCFQYYPVAPDVVPVPGTQVQASLSRPSSFDLGAETLHDVTRVEGKMVQADGDSLGVWVHWFYRDRGPKVEGYNAEYYLERNTIGQLGVWRFAPQKTLLTSAVAGGLMVAVALIGLHGGFGGSGGIPPDRTQ